MLTGVDLSPSVGKKEYKEAIRRMGKELAGLQLALREKRIPVVIAIDGPSAAGKSGIISKIVYPLDPRHFKVRTMGKVTEDEAYRPFLWGYWTKLPADGDMVIFDKSWGRAVASHERKLGDGERAAAYGDINAFQRQLQDSGMLVIKLFLLIGQDEQYHRLKELESNRDTAWRVNHADYEQNKKYDDCIKRFGEMLEHTGGGGSPWHVIPAEDSRYAAVKAFEIIIAEVKAALARGNDAPGGGGFVPEAPPELASAAREALSGGEYRGRLKALQKRMSELCYRLYSRRRAVAIVYEGWDAAGKGGNIKRLTEELDPRGYEVVTISAPTSDELAHHYLWRFYNRLPKDGHIAIFDRSWYGRVMVERVEGFAKPHEWQRAYSEINEMERHWANHGVTIFKFWLQIDRDEQLRRFQARQADPAKQYKITGEDWRNREKWGQYEAALGDMLARTDTEYAPWDVVPANDKKSARVYVLERVVAELEKTLGDSHGKD